jgi:hypothetical protein
MSFTFEQIISLSRNAADIAIDNGAGQTSYFPIYRAMVEPFLPVGDAGETWFQWDAMGAFTDRIAERYSDSTMGRWYVRPDGYVSCFDKRSGEVVLREHIDNMSETQLRSVLQWSDHNGNYDNLDGYSLIRALIKMYELE